MPAKPTPTTSGTPAAPAAPQPDRQEPEYVDIDEQEDLLVKPPSPEELAIAKSQLDKMTPEDFFYLTQQLQAARKQEGFPEARCIVWGDIVSDKGALLNITFRGASGMEVLEDVVRTLHFAKSLHLELKKEKKGAAPPAPNGAAKPKAGAPAATQPAQPAKPAPAKPAAQATQPDLIGENSFLTNQLSATIKNGTAYWEMSSAERYPKYPVRIWKEPMAEVGFDLLDTEVFDPMVVYDFLGYRAYYDLNEKGNPHKIIKLVPLEA